MTTKIRIGIIGLGYLGKFHYQKYMSNPSVNVTSVVDTDKTNFQIITDRNIFKSESYRDIIDKVDAVSIVTPTITHFKIAKFFLESKKHVLLEKPMTETVSQASLINKIAKVNKCILQIGHLEQFNPAIKKLKSSSKIQNLLRFIAYVNLIQEQQMLMLFWIL